MKTTGQQLRALRLARNLSQDAVAAATGIPQPEISRIEANRSTNDGATQTLREFLNHDLLGRIEPESPQLPDIQAIFRPLPTRWSPEKPTIPFEVRLNQARLEFGPERIQPWFAALSARDRDILSTLILDSSWEYVFAARLLGGGWAFAKASPLSLGCRWFVRGRQQPVYLGDVQRWVLCKLSSNLNLALFPQVSLGPGRVDFAGVATRDGCRAEWRVEIDGPKHLETIERDLRQTLAVDLPTLRLDRAALADPHLLLRVEAFAAPLCQARPRTRSTWR